MSSGSKKLIDHSRTKSNLFLTKVEDRLLCKGEIYKQSKINSFKRNILSLTKKKDFKVIKECKIPSQTLKTNNSN